MVVYLGLGMGQRSAGVICAIVVALLGGCIESRGRHELSGESEAAGTARPEGATADAASDSGYASEAAGESAAADRAAGDPSAGGDSPSRSALALNPFDNFHTIAEGRAYRSAQLPAEKLLAIIEAYEIKTVVNLRGPNPGEEWYDEEKAACEAAGVRMVDVPLSAGSLPPKEHLLTLYDLFQDTSAEPLLIHCRGGADRSGMISAMWRLEVLGDDRESALRELSWLYGHFPARYPSMTEFIRMFEPSREWIEQEYNPTAGGEATDN